MRCSFIGVSVAALCPLGLSSQDELGADLNSIIESIDPASADSRRSGAQRVAALGPEVIPDILLELGRSDDQSGTRRDVFIMAARAIPDADLSAALRPLALDGANSELRPGAINLLGGRGTIEDLRLMIRIAGTEVDELSDDLRSAVAEILRRRPATFSSLWSAVRDAPDPLLPAVVDAVSDVGNPLGLATLSGLLNDDRRISNHRVLHAITLIAERARPPFDTRVLTDVRQVLERASGDDLAAAARAAGHLEDFEATGTLIELLDSKVPRVKTEALDGLRILTGLNFRSDSRRWSAWYESERRWWRDDAPKVIAALESSETAEVLAAVNAIVSRRLFRNELATELSRLLDRSDEALRSLACSGWRSLARAPSSRF